jgi:hypothetical protein
MGCLYVIIIGFIAGLVLGPPLAILLMVGKAGAKRQARKILSGEIPATESEINKLIDRFMVVEKGLTEEDRDIVEKLRKLKAEAQ